MIVGKYVKITLVLAIIEFKCIFGLGYQGLKL